MAKENNCPWCKGDHHPAQCLCHVSKNVARARQAQLKTTEGKPADAAPKGDAQGDTAAKPASMERWGVAHERQAPRSQESSQVVGGWPYCWHLAGWASADRSSPCTEPAGAECANIYCHHTVGAGELTMQRSYAPYLSTTPGMCRASPTKPWFNRRAPGVSGAGQCPLENG